MNDYRNRILDRASILNLKISINELDNINRKVNDRVNYGLHINDALDYAYFYMKNKLVF